MCFPLTTSLIMTRFRLQWQTASPVQTLLLWHCRAPLSFNLEILFVKLQLRVNGLGVCLNIHWQQWRLPQIMTVRTQQSSTGSLCNKEVGHHRRLCNQNRRITNNDPSISHTETLIYFWPPTVTPTQQVSQHIQRTCTHANFIQEGPQPAVKPTVTTVQDITIKTQHVLLCT